MSATDLIVTLTPGSGRWRLDGSPWRNSGVTLYGVTTGSHFIEYYDLGSYLSPAAETITVVAGTNTLSRSYTELAQLTVNLSPTAGRWRLDGSAWRNSGATLYGVTIGAHLIEYYDLGNYVTPGAETVTLVAGTNTLSRTYTELAQLTVNLSPATSRWRIDGGAWSNSGATYYSVPLGPHLIEYYDPVGSATLPPETVTLTGGPLTLSRTLLPAGSSAQLTITLTPGTGQWRVDGGALQASGATVTGLAAGSHSITYNSVSGYSAPATESVTLTAGQSLSLSRSYIALPAQLTITLTPGTGQWRVDAGAWQASGATVTGLAAGDHPVEYNGLAGYTSPASESVTLTAGQSLSLTRSYTALPAQLTVSLTPGTGQWRVDGGALQASGATVTGLTVGSHTITYNALSGYTAPATESVTLTAGQSLSISRSYTALPAQLTVTLTPGTGQWRIDGGAWLASGATATGLAVGSHSITYKDISGYDAPWTESVVLSAGQSLSLSRNYTPLPAQIEMVFNHPDGQWRVDGGAWLASFAVVSGLTAGDHTLEYNSIPGFTAPPTETVTLSPGGYHSYNRSYLILPAQLTITLTPASGQWRIDSGDWQDSGATVTGIYAIGSHTIEYSSLTGYTAPATESVTFTGGQSLSLSRSYTALPAQLTVTLTPGTGQWRVDAGAWQASGATVTGLSVGSHTVDYNSLSGYVAPATETVSLAAGQALSLNRSYPNEPTQITVTLTPGTGQWRLTTETAWRASGTSVAVTPGVQSIYYAPLTGYNSPLNETVTVSAGQSLDLARSYAAVTAPPSYTAAQIVSLGGAWTYANGINNSSTVAGARILGGATFRAYSYSGGVMQDLGTLGGTSSIADDINASGTIAGQAQTAAGLTHAFVTSGGTLQDLGTLGGTFSSAAALSDTGVIVGVSNTVAGKYHAFRFESGSMADLGTLGGNNSYAYGINLAGVIVGQADTAAGTSHAYALTAGTMQDLGTFGGPRSTAYDVNDAGIVVGGAETPAGYNHAFAFSGGSMQDLGTLGGQTSSVAGAINNAGTVVGYAYNTLEIDLRPFVCVNGVPTDINTLVSIPGVLLTQARDINDLGQIIVHGTDFVGEMDFILTPVVAPYASLQVNLTPGTGQWRVDGGAWQISGATVSPLVPGNHTIEYNNLAGNTAPATETITLSAGQSPSLDRSYTAVQYTFVDLGTLGGSSTHGQSLNLAGTVTGYSQITGDAGEYAFRYNGAMENLGLAGSQGNAINDAGDVVGTVAVAGSPGTKYAFLYSGGTAQNLGTFGGSNSEAYGVNAAGAVVGFAQAASGLHHAFRYSGGVMTDLGTLSGGADADAFGLNDAGVVVGRSTSSGGAYHAFSYNGGVMTDLGTLGGLHSAAVAVNESGVIVGYSFAPGSSFLRAFRYSGGVMQDLGTLNSFAGANANAIGLNEAGDIVGVVTVTASESRAFIVKAGGTMQDLNAMVSVPGVVLANALGINDLGQIVANGSNNRAYLLTPINAPGGLQVGLTPATGQWRVDGGAWQASSSPVLNLAIGNHTVEYNSLANYTTPATETVTIASGRLLQLSRSYAVVPTAQLTVTLTPGTGQWRVDGGAWQASGATVTGLAVGNHTIEYNSLAGNTNPPSETITLTAGQVAQLTRTYVPLLYTATSTGVIGLYDYTGANSGGAHAINLEGAVAGGTVLHGQIVGYIYTDGVLEETGNLGGPGFNLDLNDSRVTAGFSLTGVYVDRKATRYANGVLQGFNNDGTAFGVNSAGAVVGSTGSGSAFLFVDGVLQDLGKWGGTAATALDINGAGVIVGLAGTSNTNYQAVRYHDGLVEIIPGLGGTVSRANAINNAGVIVGDGSLSGSSPAHAFRSEAGVTLDLGTLGGPNSRALDLNEAGVIVGWSEVAASTPHAFVYRDGSMLDLNSIVSLPAGVVLTAATGVNASGQIIANGSDAIGYILTPATNVGGVSVQLADGAGQWRVNGGAWQNSSAVVAGLAAGSYSIEYAALAGYSTPVAETATINGGRTTVLRRTFAALPPPAGLITWAATGTDFATNTNWIGSITPANNVTNNTARFTGDFSFAQPVLAASRSIGGLLQDASATTDLNLTGAGTLTVGANGIGNAKTSGTMTIAVPLVFATADTPVDVPAGGQTVLSGNLSGNSLSKSGAGTLTLLGSAAQATTHVAGGTLQIGNGGAGGAVTGGIAADSGTSVVFNRAGDFTHSGTLTGNGSLTKLGTNTLQLESLGNTIKNISVSAGTLSLLLGGQFDSPPVVTVAAGATLQVESESVTSLTGGGQVQFDYLQIGANTGAGTSTFPGVLSGSGSLEKLGLSTWVLSGASTFNGSMFISEGDVTAGAVNTLSSQSFVSVNATLNLANFNQNVKDLVTGPAGIVNLGSATLTINTGSPGGVFSGTINGTGGLRKQGANPLRLSSSHLNFTGTMEIFGGSSVTVVGGSSCLPATAPLLVDSGGSLVLTTALTSQAVGSLAGLGTVDLRGSTLSVGGNNTSTTFSGAIAGTGPTGGLTKIGTGVLTLAGSNTYVTPTTINAGTLRLGASNVLANTTAVTVASGATFDLNGFGDAVGSIAGAGNITMSIGLSPGGDNTSTTFSGLISGTGSLTKLGTGTLALTRSAGNTYTGTTAINAGTLRIGNTSGSALGTAAVTVAAGATLAGTGSFTGGVTLNGILSPGNTLGTVTSGSQTWNGGGSYLWEINNATGTAGTNWDRTSITGTLALAATPASRFTVSLRSLTAAFAPGQTPNFNSASSYSFTLASAGSITGFNASAFTIDTSGFANAFTGTWSVAQVGSTLNLVYTPPPATAQVTVTLTPGTGQWRIDGGAWQASGATVTGLLVGSHSVEYNSLSGYTAPATESVTLTAGQSLALTRSYTVIPAQLTVTLTPASGQWRVDGGAWQASGATVTGLSVGSHTVEYNSLSGYTAPATESVTLTAGQSLALTRSYTVIPPQLTVTLTPASGQWRVDGGAWQASGATVTGLSVGSHTIEYNSLSGYTAPATESVTLTAGQSLSITRGYTVIPAQLTVTLAPASGQWRVDGGAWQASGATVTGLSVGSHTIEYNSLSGYTALAAESVTLTAGQSLSLSRSYTAASYTVEDLGSFGGTTRAMDLNLAGTVAGSSIHTATSLYRAFIYRNGIMQDLLGKYSEAYGINDAGTVVGNTSNSLFKFDGATEQSLGSLGAAGGTAQAINRSGTVVGGANHSDGHQHVYRFSNGTIQDLALLGVAHGINDAGIIVGSADLGAGTHAFRYTSGVVADLGTLGGSYSVANAINESGVIVGYANLPANVSNHAFRYTSGAMEDLGTLDGPGASSAASDINESGDVVGYSLVGSGNQAFIYRNGTMQNLNGLVSLQGIVLVYAAAINDLGQIAVNGSNNHAYLLTPVNAPGGLQVDLTPSAAQWRVDGGAWQASGTAVLNLAIGSHSIEYNSLSGYLIPVPETVTVASGRLLQLTRSYSALPLASVRISTSPPGATTALWRLDGGAWQAPGTTLDNLAFGVPHTVEFSAVVGYVTPAPQTFTLASGELRNLYGDYSPLASVRISTSPPGATTALWRLDGGAWQAPGTTLDNLAFGVPHTVEFSAVVGYVTPAPQTFTLASGELRNLYGDYTPLASVRISTSPPGATTALWRLDGGAWQAPGTTLDNLAFGVPHTVEFSAVVGYVTPAPQTFTLASGELRNLYGDYSPLASVRISTSPPGATTALWRLDGGAWQAPGTTLDNLAFGVPHTVEFSAVVGYVTPAPQTFTLASGELRNLYGTYTPASSPAQVSVSLSPTRGQWRIDGGEWLDHGANVTNLAAGNHTIDYRALPNYASPPTETVTLTDGQSLNLTRVYVLTPIVQYSVTDLGNLGGPGATNVTALNFSGMVTGTSHIAGGPARAFLYRDGAMQSLGTLGSDLYSFGYGLNDDGDVVGMSFTAADPIHPFVYRNGVMQDLGSLGGTIGTAYDISNTGFAVGRSQTTPSQAYAFIHDGTSMVSLGSLGGTDHIAYAISDDGIIVGAARVSAAYHAFRWQDGVMQDVNPLLNTSTSYAYDVNEAGTLVGTRIAGGDYRAFRLTAAGVMQDLGRLGATYAYARAINGAGQVVGNSSTDTGNHAFLERGAGIEDLNDLVNLPGVVLEFAEDINDLGQIAANGSNGHAYLLTPLNASGGLQVSLTPSTAQWRVDGGAWQASGATVPNLTNGSHTVEYNSVSGYTTPATETVAVPSGQLLQLSRSYATVPPAQLTVTLTPGSGQWRVDSGAWQASGATVSGLAVGSHTVEYNALSGYTAPATETVTLSAGQSLSISRSYTALPAQLTITLTPTSGQWRVDGGALQASGATVTGLAAGSHTITYNALSGYTAPATETVTLTAGQSLSISRSYTVLPAQLTITLTPTTGQWRVDGGALQASGATVTGLAAGSHTITYNALAGYTAPATETVTLTAGQSLSLSRSYTVIASGPTEFSITLTPSSGRWRIDGSPWRNSGVTLYDVTPGSHFIEYYDIGNYLSPVAETVTVVVGTNALTRTYTALAQLTVTLTPNSGRWRIDGSAWRNSGATLYGVTLGAHLIEYYDLGNYVTPGAETVTLVAGTNTLSRTYTELAQLTVNLSPATSRWRIDGGAWSNSGATYYSVPLGPHLIEYYDPVGSATLPPETVTLTGGPLTLSRTLTSH